MNELEEQNVQSYRVRRSVLMLLVRGSVVWLSLSLISFVLDLMPNWLYNLESQGGGFVFISAMGVTNWLPLTHFILNLLYGAVMLYLVLAWVYEYYLIRSDAIVVRRGILFSNEQLYQMEDVKTITVEQGFWGKLFNIGTVRFFAHKAGKDVSMHSIDNPHGLAAHMHELHPSPDTVQVSTVRKPGISIKH